MNFNEYQKKVEGFMNPKTLADSDKRLCNAVIGLAEEAGEVCGLVKKWKFHENEFDRSKFILELSDVAFYLAECASAVDCALEEVPMRNIGKLTKRYPSGRFTVEDSIAKKDQNV